MSTLCCCVCRQCGSDKKSGVCVDNKCQCRLNRYEADGTSSLIASDPTCTYTLLDLEPTMYYSMQVFVCFILAIDLIVALMGLHAIARIRQCSGERTLAAVLVILRARAL